MKESSDETNLKTKVSPKHQNFKFGKNESIQKSSIQQHNEGEGDTPGIKYKLVDTDIITDVKPNPDNSKITSRQFGERTYNLVVGDEPGFKLTDELTDTEVISCLDVIERSMLQADMKNIMTEGGLGIISSMPSRKLPSISASMVKRSQNELSKRLTTMIHSDRFTGMTSIDMHSYSEKIAHTECPTITAGLTSPHYWIIIFVVTTSLSYDYFLNSVWKDYGRANVVGSSDHSITNVMIIASLCNSFVRVFIGKLLATVSYKKFYLCLLAFKLVSALCLKLSTGSIYSYAITISYAYICIGSQSTLFPTFCVKVFGSKVGAKMFPMVYFFFAMANVLQWGLNFFIFSDNLDTLIWILTGFVAVGFVLTCFINETPDWTSAIEKAKVEQFKKNGY